MLESRLQLLSGETGLSVEQKIAEVQESVRKAKVRTDLGFPKAVRNSTPFYDSSPTEVFYVKHHVRVEELCYVFTSEHK